MGALLSSSYRQEQSERQPGINQIYNVEYGSAPIGPVGTIASTPKRYLYNSGLAHRHRRGRARRY